MAHHRPATIWEALIHIARCGRAVPVLQGGVVRIFRDAAQTLPIAMFGPRNIVKGSFKIQYIMPGEETADAVTVAFFNARTWKQDEVTAALPGSTASKPAKVAVGVCPYPIQWDDRERQTLFAGYVLATAKAMGVNLRWGGDWNRNTEVRDNGFDDLVHFELVEE